MSLIDDIRADRAEAKGGPWYTQSQLNRIPAMEDALLAADELAGAYAQYRDRPAMDNPDDWQRMDVALAAYRAATGAS